MAEDALHALFAAVLASSTTGEADKEADFARYIEPDPDGMGESVYLYIGLYAESDLD